MTRDRMGWEILERTHGMNKKGGKPGIWEEI